MIYSILQQVISKNDIYYPLIASLARNELALIPKVSEVIAARIQQEVFSLSVLLIHYSSFDIGVVFFNTILPRVTFLEYCSLFYNYIVHLPLSSYSTKVCSDLWLQFISFVRARYNKYKDTMDNLSFIQVLLQEELSQNQSTLLYYIITLTKLAITTASVFFSLHTKAKMNSFSFSLFYFISLFGHCILTSIKLRMIILSPEVDYNVLYNHLITLVSSFHSFTVQITSICSEATGSFLLLQLMIISMAPFPITAESLVAIYQCLRCLFNINVCVMNYIVLFS